MEALRLDSPDVLPSVSQLTTGITHGCWVMQEPPTFDWFPDETTTMDPRLAAKFSARLRLSFPLSRGREIPELRLMTRAPAFTVSTIACDNSSGVALGDSPSGESCSAKMGRIRSEQLGQMA